MLQPKLNKYFYIAIIVYLLAVCFYNGALNTDEYSQILLFAAQKLHLINIPDLTKISSDNPLTWEYYSQIRATFLPWIAIVIYKFYALIMPSVNPYIIDSLLRLLSSILTLFSCYLFTLVYMPEIKTFNKQKWFLILNLFSYLVVITGVHFNSETISSRLFAIAFCWYFLPNMSKGTLKYLVIGLIFGFSFFCRFQIGFMILGFALWLLFINRIKLKYLWLMVLGFGLAFIFNIVLDYWFYGDLIFTPWQYFVSNLLMHKADSFGTSPWYSYILTESAFLPYGILYVVCSLYFMFKRPKHAITWVAIPFILVHVLIGHKESRFLIPLLPFMPLVVMDTLQLLQQEYQWKLAKLIKLNKLAWWLNILILIALAFIPQTTELPGNYFISTNYKTPTTIYYLSKNIFLDFYQLPYIKRQKLMDISKARCIINQGCLLNLTCNENIRYTKQLDKYVLVYSSCLNYDQRRLPIWLNKALSRIGGLSVIYDLNKLQNN